MHAMILEEPRQRLRPIDRPTPVPGPRQVLVQVLACGVCRTDLHVVDGDLTEPRLPIIPGHEIVGRIVRIGRDVRHHRVGDRIGIPWLGHTCGICPYCLDGRENLCEAPGFTGYQIDGGYADHAIADAGYCFPIVGDYSDAEAAPLLCAGLIGYRALKMTGDAYRVGIYGFGAAAHIAAQVLRHQGREVAAFTRPGDVAAQQFAMSLGCSWAGGSDVLPPRLLDAAIIFAPVGKLLPQALAAVVKGGTVVLGGIHMSDIPSMPYDLLWGERVIRSVANLTRRDAIEFLELAPRIPVRTSVTCLPLDEANTALDRLRDGDVTGALVLVPSHDTTEPTDGSC